MLGGSARVHAGVRSAGLSSAALAKPGTAGASFDDRVEALVREEQDGKAAAQLGGQGASAAAGGSQGDLAKDANLAVADAAKQVGVGRHSSRAPLPG